MVENLRGIIFWRGLIEKIDSSGEIEEK